MKYNYLLHRSQKGMINVVSFAVVLPILILLLAASIDVIRLPIVKQQLLGSINNAYYSLLVQDKTNQSLQVLAGRNLCAIPNADMPINVCSKVMHNEQGQIAANLALDHLMDELSQKDETGLFFHDKSRINAAIFLANLLVNNEGTIVGEEQIALVASKDGAKTKDIFKEQLDKLKNSALKGIWLSSSDLTSSGTKSNETNATEKNYYTQVPIAIIQVSVPVKQIFKLSRLFSEKNGKTKSDETTETVRAMLVRPLLQGVALRP